ncbi:hypothetical protein RFF05_10500 [Bengtsoniella intestinalis]|uniref:hypothetical protein n=1 Tax=Bengtsoniella intestinalis TaxID=3073143 RepID=UPI00391F39D3
MLYDYEKINNHVDELRKSLIVSLDKPTPIPYQTKEDVASQEDGRGWNPPYGG